MAAQGSLELALAVPHAAVLPHVGSHTEARTACTSMRCYVATTQGASRVVTRLCPLQAEALLRPGALGKELDALLAAWQHHCQGCRIAMQVSGHGAVEDRESKRAGGALVARSACWACMLRALRLTAAGLVLAAMFVEEASSNAYMFTFPCEARTESLLMLYFRPVTYHLCPYAGHMGRPVERRPGCAAAAPAGAGGRHAPAGRPPGCRAGAAAGSRGRAAPPGGAQRRVRAAAGRPARLCAAGARAGVLLLTCLMCFPLRKESSSHVAFSLGLYW